MQQKITPLAILVIIALVTVGYSQETLKGYGVKLFFTVDADMFPKSWLSDEINGKAIPLDSSEIDRSRRAILKALDKYPIGVIQKHLTKIYIVNYLEFYGLSYGGTNSTSEVYVTNRGVSNGYTDFWIEQAFHQEFSSILLRSHFFMFNKHRWRSISSDVKYGESGTDALRLNQASGKFDPELNSKGILHQYGTASVEEDFNSFAENLFLSSPGFWDIIASNKRAKKKADQVIKFYNRINPIFTKEYFERISKN